MPTPTLVTVLVDPGPGRRHRWVLAGEVIDRAALAHCRDRAQRDRMRHHRQRWQRGRATACANCAADAVQAALVVGVL